MSYRLLHRSAHRITSIYHGITGSIAFYPVLIALGLFFLSLITLYIDERSPGLLFGYELSVENILYPNSARALLGSIAGGMISLMVFSFSMVMVVLNQTSSNYSPRLLPNLIGRKPHQVIMGFYIGTIAYTFVVLTSIQSKLYSFGVPSLSIITSSLLTLFCLALFISFINRVSQDIQIGNIVNRVYDDTLRALKREKEVTHVPGHQLPDTEGWMTVDSPFSGYLDEVNEYFFLQATRSLDVTVRLCVPNGKFINRRDPLFKVSRLLSEDEWREISGSLIFRHQEEIHSQYAYGFKHLIEIALRGLSPGINDPSTAAQAIDRLTDLLVERLSLHGYKILADRDHHLRLIYEPLKYDDLLYLSFNTIAEYAKTDLTVTSALLTMLRTLFRNDIERQHTGTIMALLHDLVADFEANFAKQTDRRFLTKQVDSMLREHSDHTLYVPISHLLDKLGEAQIV